MQSGNGDPTISFGNQTIARGVFAFYPPTGRHVGADPLREQDVHHNGYKIS